ncbi:MAG: VCBS repeat-containing protein [Planctomycetes bacterium]|nr:VCBS repeat-containing protein [Planctomycetota bacterium]
MSSTLRLSLLYCLLTACAEEAPLVQEEALSTPGGVPMATQRTVAAPALKARLELPCSGKPDGVLLLDPSLGVGPLVAVTHDPGELLFWEELPTGWSLSTEPRKVAIPDWCLGPALLPGGVVPSIALADRSEPGLLVIDPRSGERTARIGLDYRPRALSVGDPDADRVSEVVCADASGALIVWRPGELTERFEGDPEDGLLPTCVLTASDSSGVVVGQQSSRSLRLFRSQAPGEDLSPSESIELGEIPRALVEIEVDGDPEPELAVAMGDHSVRILGVGVEGDARSWFSLEAEVLTVRVGRLPIDLEAIDFDGDGKEELFTTGAGDSYTILSAGLGGERGVRFDEYAGQLPWDGAACDIDGDGRPELAFANQAARRVSVVWSAEPYGLRQARRIEGGPMPHSIALGDLTGDGLSDSVALHSLDDHFVVLRNQDGGLEVSARAPAGSGSRLVRLSDLEGDGDLDAAWISRGPEGSLLRLAAGDGAGGLTAVGEESSKTVGRDVTDLLLEDLDGDGSPEALVADPAGGGIAWTTPALGPNAPLSELKLAPTPHHLTILSLPEGRVIACAGDGVIHLVQWTGESLELITSIQTGLVAIDVAGGDFDGDGVDDISLLGGEGRADGVAELLLFVRDRAGSWNELVRSKGGQRMHRLATGDLNGDGRSDVVGTAQNSHYLVLWLCLSAEEGGLTRCADIGVGTGPLDVALADLDGDGTLDIASANGFSNDLSTVTR